MRLNLLSLIFAVAALCVSFASAACKPRQGWTPHTPASAYQNADVVVHVRVLMQQKESWGATARVEVIRVLKGQFTRDSITTADHGMCGLGVFKVGAEYVFFFRGNGYSVGMFDQPALHISTAQILNELSSK